VIVLHVSNTLSRRLRSAITFELARLRDVTNASSRILVEETAICQDVIREAVAVQTVRSTAELASVDVSDQREPSTNFNPVVHVTRTRPAWSANKRIEPLLAIPLASLLHVPGTGSRAVEHVEHIHHVLTTTSACLVLATLTGQIASVILECLALLALPTPALVPLVQTKKTAAAQVPFAAHEAEVWRHEVVTRLDIPATLDLRNAHAPATTVVDARKWTGVWCL